MKAQELWISRAGEQDEHVWTAPPCFFQREGAFWKERGPGSESFAVPVKNVYEAISLEVKP